MVDAAVRRRPPGWRGYRKPEIARGVAGWTGPSPASARPVTSSPSGRFKDFEALEWKVAPGGNSGIFFRVTEEGEESYHTGILLDDAAHPGYFHSGRTYGLYPRPAGIVKPAASW